MAAALEMVDVWKTYQPGPVNAVKGVNLSIQAGEVVLILGPSGSGKTTLLEMLGTMLTPSKGVIRIAGRSLAELAEADVVDLRRRHIGFIFQSFNLFPSLTALENVEIVLQMQKASDVRRRAIKALESVSMGNRLDFYPRQLSGGQQQRIAVARALVHEPRVILADEPTGALDTNNGLAVMLILTAMARQAGTAVVVVTHDLRLRQLANRTFKMEDGALRDWTKEWEPSVAEILGAKKKAE